MEKNALSNLVKKIRLFVRSVIAVIAVIAVIIAAALTTGVSLAAGGTPSVLILAAAAALAALIAVVGLVAYGCYKITNYPKVKAILLGITTLLGVGGILFIAAAVLGFVLPALGFTAASTSLGGFLFAFPGAALAALTMTKSFTIASVVVPFGAVFAVILSIALVATSVVVARKVWLIYQQEKQKEQEKRLKEQEDEVSKRVNEEYERVKKKLENDGFGKKNTKKRRVMTSSSLKNGLSEADSIENTAQLSDEKIDVPDFDEFFGAAKKVIASHKEWIKVKGAVNLGTYIFGITDKDVEINAQANAGSKTGKCIFPEVFSDDEIYSIKVSSNRGGRKKLIINDVANYLKKVAENSGVKNIKNKLCINNGSTEKGYPTVFFTKEIMRAVLKMHEQYKGKSPSVDPR